MVTIKLTIQEILNIKSLAKQFVIDCDGDCRMPGISRTLAFDERLVLAYMSAMTSVLNRRGAFNEGWLKTNVVKLEDIDFEPDFD